MLDIETKVRIKSYKEIQKTLDKKGRCNGLYFNPDMRTFCGIPSSITTHSSNWYQLKNTQGYYWVPEWFDVVEEVVYLNDGSIEQRSLCLALIRQTMSGNEPHLSIFTPNTACTTKDCGGFNYSDFREDGWHKTIAKNIPDWPCLNLKPEILEEAIRNCLSQHNLQYFKTYVVYNISSWFIFSNTEKPDFWYTVADRLSTIHLETVKDTNIEQPIKTQKDEIKFQRKKGCVLRGTVPEGNQQSSGKCKATTCSGHLGYQVCTGR